MLDPESQVLFTIDLDTGWHVRVAVVKKLADQVGTGYIPRGRGDNSEYDEQKYKIRLFHKQASGNIGNELSGEMGLYSRTLEI
jgi:hypothetical protein